MASHHSWIRRDTLYILPLEETRASDRPFSGLNIHTNKVQMGEQDSREGLGKTGKVRVARMVQAG